MVLEQLDVHMQKMNIDTDLSSFTKVDKRCTIELNIKHKIGNLLEDNIEDNFHDL